MNTYNDLLPLSTISTYLSRISSKGILSRQKLPELKRSTQQLKNINKGAYIIYEKSGRTDAIILATGSEVHLAIEAAKSIKNYNGI